MRPPAIFFDREELDTGLACGRGVGERGELGLTICHVEGLRTRHLIDAQQRETLRRLVAAD
jgi:hypothetical protein